MSYSVTRKIGIDAGHRIMTYGSKCNHPHGHHYTVEATCVAKGERLHDHGEQKDMVLDFGFLKDEMLRHIASPCDHGFIVSLADRELLEMFAPSDVALEMWLEEVASHVRDFGDCVTMKCRLGAKIYVVPFQPTAECLARHWFGCLAPAVCQRSNGGAQLTKVTVWETPNCMADYCLFDAGSGIEPVSA